MRSHAIGTAVACIGLVVVGCSSGGSSVRTSAGTAVSPSKGAPSADGRSPLAAGHRAIGPACHDFPAAGPGSLTAMASAPAAAAAAQNPLLHEFERAVTATGLTGRLNSASAITIFAPDNAAFLALGPGNLSTLNASKPDLAKVIEDHIVSGRISPADLASRRRLATLRGTVIVPVKTAGGYRVNNAGVVCGNIQTANATIYIVDTVLVARP
jgi:uncharacterized surface protein with fasciclin (FAS1) repeats